MITTDNNVRKMCIVWLKNQLNKLSNGDCIQEDYALNIGWYEKISYIQNLSVAVSSKLFK